MGTAAEGAGVVMLPAWMIHTAALMLIALAGLSMAALFSYTLSLLVSRLLRDAQMWGDFVSFMASTWDRRHHREIERRRQAAEGTAAEGAGVVTSADRAVSPAEYGAEEADARAREAEDHEEAFAFLVPALRKKLRAQKAFTTGAVIAAAIVAVALLLVLALPAHAEPPRLTEARTAQTSCVLREYRTRTASAGVSAREAALVARLGAEHACALEGWARALGAAAEVRVVTATRAPVVCEPANSSAGLTSCEDRPTWIDVLSHGGACALCGGGVALGAWATCGGVR